MVDGLLFEEQNECDDEECLDGLTIAAFVVCYGFRMMYGDGDVVYFHPQEGIFSWIVTCRDWI